MLTSSVLFGLYLKHYFLGKTSFVGHSLGLIGADNIASKFSVD